MVDSRRRADRLRETASADYERFCRPEVGRRLRAMHLDAVYERAEGDILWRRNSHDLVEILDLAGGFGSTILGHNHPVLVEAATALLRDRRPHWAQGSVRPGAATLARALAERLGGDFVTILTNSGTETVEAAMKHAFLARPYPLFWAIEGAFHGKTLGSIQLTSSYRRGFTGLGPSVRFLDPDDPADWERARNESEGKVAAAFVEPILGEGGVRPLPPQMVEWLGRTCDDLDIPVVADEIQTGLGRTGSFLASEGTGLRPRYVCLAKSLGGGISKIGALLIAREDFVDEFATIHSSTFAEDDPSSVIALKTLEVIDADDVPARCAALGTELRLELERLRERFPDCVKEVRGRGLMVGVELIDRPRALSNVVATLAQHRYLGWAAASYLLNVHRIRVLPTLGDPLTLRVEPSAYLARSNIHRFVDALSSLCKALRHEDAGHLTGFLAGSASMPSVDRRPRHVVKHEDPAGARKVAFIGHLVAAEDLPHFDPSLADLAPTSLESYARGFSEVFGPSIYDEVKVTSATGDEVHLTFVGLNLTAKQIKEALVARRTKPIRQLIESAVALARDAGCEVAGLGGYTSSLTGSCRQIRTDGIALTSGNALTVGMSVAALTKRCIEAGIEISETEVGIVGAPGNIASTFASILAGSAPRLTLVARDASSGRVADLVERIHAERDGVSITVSDDPAALRSCSVIVAASAAGGGVIQPQHLSPGRVVVCDISVPADVAPTVAQVRPDVTVIKAGIVKLPFDPDFRISGVPLTSGRAFACLAETLLMGLEGMTSHGSYGEISGDQVGTFVALAERHGFAVDVVPE